GWAQPDSLQIASPDSVTFTADEVAYNVETKQIELIGNATLHYREMQLQAGHILFDQDTRVVTAQALPDSTGAKTLGLPQFAQNSQKLSAEYMVYNLNTERGSVRTGRATYERKYYRGDHILLDSEKAMDALDLSLSTCDKDHVHYDFLCKNVRVLQNDKAIGRSVTFRIGPIPIFWVPFFVFPVKQGRQSGLLTPGVGSNSRDGIFVRNIGYYFAPSEYWDATLKGTVRERGGFLLESRLLYALRNRFSGNIDVGYERNTSGASAAHNWRLNLQHQQRLNATTNIRGSGQFSTSTSFDQRNSNDLYRYLNQQLRSSLSFDKRWTESSRSIDGSLTYYRDLDEKSNSFQGFPRLSFRQSRRRIFGNNDATTSAGPWYRAFYYGFSSNLSNNFTRTPDPDPNTERLTLQNLVTINSQHRPMGWLDLTPSFNLNEEFIHSDTDSTTRRSSYSAALTSGTTLYGIFQPQMGRLRGIRHRFQPQINFNYNQTGKISHGTFGVGGTRDWGDARRTLNFNIGNSLELKTEHNDDFHRFTLATLNVSTGYDFDTPGQKWRLLRTNATLKPDRRVDVRLNMSHKLYDDAGNRSLLHPRLQNLTITSNFRFTGDRNDQTIDSTGPTFSPSEADFGFERDLYTDFSDVTQPWRFNLSHFIEMRRAFSTAPMSKRSWVKADFGINPTQTFRVDYSINIDMLPNARLSAQNLTLYKDLHCWEARFSYYPTGFNKGFFFKINIKDIPQIKFEHRRGGLGI
ncbi:MAG: putative LPS assembly protein LptD, partial [Candidatus Latescibacteria bacterium]|nr:putative LPS assembly protein LptD [Candidatus Latescibacterota bacterium]